MNLNLAMLNIRRLGGARAMLGLIYATQTTAAKPEPKPAEMHNWAGGVPRHLRNYCKSIFEFGRVIVNLKAMTFRMVDSLLCSFEVLSVTSHQGSAFPALVCLL